MKTITSLHLSVMKLFGTDCSWQLAGNVPLNDILDWKNFLANNLCGTRQAQCIMLTNLFDMPSNSWANIIIKH
jgi:hypothetical protein